MNIRGGSSRKNVERDEKVIAAYNSGTTNYTQLGMRFGMTRCAVSGVLRRGRDAGRCKSTLRINRVEYRDPSLADPTAPKRSRRRSTSIALRAVEKVQREAPKPRLVIPVKLLPPVTSDPFEQRERRRLAFEQMTDSKGCKFPVGDPLESDFHFCCAPRIAGNPYCGHHYSITHVQGSAIEGRRRVPRATSLHMAAE